MERLISFTQFLYELYLGTDVPKPGGGKTLPVFNAQLKKRNKKNDRNSTNQDLRQNQWPTGRGEESNEEYIMEVEDSKPVHYHAYKAILKHYGWKQQKGPKEHQDLSSPDIPGYESWHVWESHWKHPKHKGHHINISHGKPLGHHVTHYTDLHRNGHSKIYFHASEEPSTNRFGRQYIHNTQNYKPEHLRDHLDRFHNGEIKDKDVPYDDYD